MAIELVLKLLGRLPSNDFKLQTEWNNFKLGNFCIFDGYTIEGITFHHRFSVARGESFPLDQLFEAIDHELEEDRYVIVSLSVGEDYHNFVIFNQTPNGEYEATSKAMRRTWTRSDVKEKIRAMKGTDILTYDAIVDGSRGQACDSAILPEAKRR